MIPREVTDRGQADWSEKATGIPAERILISATHTHTAPTVAGVFQSDPDEDVPEIPGIEKIAAGIAKAHAQRTCRRQDRLGGRQGCGSQVFNRRWKVKPGSALLARSVRQRRPTRSSMNPGFLHRRSDRAGRARRSGRVAFISVQSGRRPADWRSWPTTRSTTSAACRPCRRTTFALFAERMSHPARGRQASSSASCRTARAATSTTSTSPKRGPGKQAQGEQARIVAESVSPGLF
jgi:hypothetical protein